MPSLHQKREMRALKRSGKIPNLSGLSKMSRLTPREKFAYTVAVFIVLGIAVCVSAAKSQTIIQITQEQARMAIVKAVGMGYDCRDKGLTLASCLTMAVSNFSK